MGRFRRILWLGVALLVLGTGELRAGRSSPRSVSTEVVGSERAEPGETVAFRVTVSGGAPRASVTIYEQLGSSLGRKPGKSEMTSWFVAAAALLLLLAGALSALWSPRIP